MRLGPGLLASALACSACGAPFPSPGAAQLGALRAKDPGARIEDLEHGRSLYLAKCGGCHLLVVPTKFAPEAWPAKVARMQSEKRVHLAPDELRDIERYVVAVSGAAR